MKIAVTYDNGEVFGHFGRTEFFKVYEVADNKVVIPVKSSVQTVPVTARWQGF